MPATADSNGRRLGVDVGGTFTDAVLIDGDRLVVAKVPTTPNQEEAVVAAAAAVGAGIGGNRGADAGADRGADGGPNVGAAGDGGDTTLDRFTHGTTVATNALLERRGARTALVTTAGFEHLLHLRRQTRANLYRPSVQHPEPLVPLERSVGVEERIGPNGVIRPLELETLPELDQNADAIAVCLLFAFRDSRHERAVTEELRRRHPNAHVVASHEIAPEFREYERASTTVADAYLAPVTARYLRALADACEQADLPEPLVMRSSGGVVSLEEAAAHPSMILVSGPAGGVVGAAHVARLAGYPDAISLDIGGTSTDVCLIENGHATRSTERVVAGFPIRLPTVDIETVGAGGGSIVWVDSGGALRVGPQSAGAWPGPACYGRGGVQPTLTDANLLLGRLPRELPGGLILDEEAAAQAFGDIDPRHAVAVANAEMLRALRLVSVERGSDPRGFALIAFGGAGPLHACELAEELGVSTVLVPRAAGVLSALGLVASEERREHVRSEVRPLAEIEDDLPSQGEVDVRYKGQGFELSVPLGGDVAADFHAAHEERYGYADRNRPLEVVAVRTAETRPAPTLDLRGGATLSAQGPTVVELEGATCWVPSGWAGATDDHGTLVLEHA